ncbi:MULTISPECIES: DUF3303 domain-containing protein [Bradyrhizobium]|uniref:DUF3303 domain-containing protein n=1 Tax=Bradyrhizobium TaxID=374 RepID=UPI000F51BC34|nr:MULTISPECIES: DUF3303 family protein [Bradyrhizobium]RQH15702.1 DUF3303 domain-containing protein [Bradyrhizobium sp. RP6]
MKYMIEYKVRHGQHYEQNFGAAEALLTAFGKWKPEDGLTIQAFVSNLMGDGGYVLVETNDPTVIVSFVSKFSYWNDAEVIPVIDVREAAATGAGSLEWARNASKN